MPMWSPSGGLWLGCFACGADAAAIVQLVGTTHGEPIQAERAVCEEHALCLLLTELPTDLAAGDRLLQVEVQWPLELGEARIDQ
jgi:hypothetical protein